MKCDKVPLLFIPMALSLCILVICYPGFMSYDSIRMLEEARSSVRGGIYPAFPVYLLRIFDIAGSGVTAMIQAQNFILLFSLMFILRTLKAGWIASSISLLAVVAMPTVIGGMLVLWKDVTLASLVVLSFAIIFFVSQSGEDADHWPLLKWTSLFFLMTATLVRFNAITSTAVVAFYWLTVFYRNQSWKRRGGSFVMIVLCMVISNNLINNRRFPSFEKLEKNPIVYAIMIYDVIGTSGWSRVSMVPIDSRAADPLPKADIADIDGIYSSLGALAMNDNNIAQGNIVRAFPARHSDDDVVRAWVAAVTSQPVAYLLYRWDLFSEIIGAKNYATFEPTHFNRIDGNQFGIQFEDRYITQIALNYIAASSAMLLGKPWLIFFLSFISLILVFSNRSIRQESKMLSFWSFIAAMFYILPFFIISGTGEVRYSFPAIIFSSLSLFVWIFSKFQPRS